MVAKAEVGCRTPFGLTDFFVQSVGSPECQRAALAFRSDLSVRRDDVQ